jgi:hypothetical protein
MDDQNTPACSPNVGDIRWLGAKSVMLLCQTCPHRQFANVEILPDDVPLALVASKFVCPQCHQEGVYVLPNWGPSTAAEPPKHDDAKPRPRPADHAHADDA